MNKASEPRAEAEGVQVTGNPSPVLSVMLEINILPKVESLQLAGFLA